MTPKNPKLSELIGDHELCTLISEPTCFKSINPTCIDNFLTNKKAPSMKTLTFETGASDHHKLIDTVLRSTFAKEKLKKCFNVAIKTLAIKGLKKNYKSNYSQCQILNNIILHLKSFYNNQTFMTKTHRKAIMKRSKLRNKFNGERNIESWSKYRHQRNLCSNLLKQSKASTSNDIPISIIKNFAICYCEKLANIFND